MLEIKNMTYEIQDNADSASIYNTLEEKIIPAYYDKNRNGISDKWMQLMKNSIISLTKKYPFVRMDYYGFRSDWKEKL